MLPNSAYSLIPIVASTNYAPQPQTIDVTNPNTGLPDSPAIQVPNGLTPPIFAIWCTSAPSGPVTFTTIGSATPVTVPATAFVAGVVYNIYLAEMTSLGGGTFVGYKYVSLPQVY